ncbi:hypothetical protein EsDP_00002477 [Epichloe bromicola]|uniref:Uncharacterized protein n=1 Tax=Epichloe bromicola TaxID=79588 RepID=A0ABQ0CLE4_9HYPO
MSAALPRQDSTEPNHLLDQADETMEQVDTKQRYAPSGQECDGPEPHAQSTKKTVRQRGPASSLRQPPPQQHHQTASLRSLIIFHPRPYEEIFAEQAYLSLTSQSHTSRLCDLVSRYHMAEEESIYGESRKMKRRARRQVGILRSQIRYAAEQEKTIFVRLGELQIEARSREALDSARHHSTRQCLSRSDGARGQGRPSISESRLNGATAEFIPQEGEGMRDQRADSAVDVLEDSDDEQGEMDEDKLSCGFHTPELRMSLDDMTKLGSRLRRPRRLSGDLVDYDALMLRRQLSMPNMGTNWPR